VHFGRVSFIANVGDTGMFVTCTSMPLNTEIKADKVDEIIFLIEERGITEHVPFSAIEITPGRWSESGNVEEN
jgi:hypothetical protein